MNAGARQGPLRPPDPPSLIWRGDGSGGACALVHGPPGAHPVALWWHAGAWQKGAPEIVYRAAWAWERARRMDAEAQRDAAREALAARPVVVAEHRWLGECPEDDADAARDPACPACRALGAP